MFKEYTVTITPKITAYAGASVFGEYTVTVFAKSHAEALKQARAERREAGTADRGTIRQKAIRQLPAGIGKPPAHEGASPPDRAFGSPWREKGQPVQCGAGFLYGFRFCRW